MLVEKTAAPIPLGEVHHVCALFFNGNDEAFRVLLPFTKLGFACGDKVVRLVNSGERCEHLQRLTVAGIHITAAEQSGQLELRTNTEAYLRDGRFDQDRMLKVFKERMLPSATAV
jgi:hypothetical protein